MATHDTTSLVTANLRITSPRQMRALVALWSGPKTRKELDHLAGCSNSPDLISALRRKGINISCEIREIRDRDGRKSYPGVYHLEVIDRLKVGPLLKSFKLPLRW
jgi:hypothetical protein